ncbi:hypothetical protein K8I85_09105 [bacterium]|nr:hypothetical protein [bacterium]
MSDPMTDSSQAAPAPPPGVKCKYCGMMNCTMGCEGTTEAGVAVTPGDATHTMAGVPPSIAIGGVAVMILLSHFLLARRRSVRAAGSYPRFDLLRWKPLASLVKRPGFPLLLQGVSVFLFLLVIVAGLFGSQRTNIAPALTWTWWWALLIFGILFFGTGFCAVCPWEGLSSLVSSLSFTSRIKKVGMEWKWPRHMKKVYLALALFILLTWLELGLDITRSASMTAALGGGFVAMAILSAILFERRSFCRYVCFVGRIQGLYALFSPVELRPRSLDTCRTCVGKECYHGGGGATGCPTSIFPGALKENTNCTLCTECVRACPHDNLAINVRPFGVDLGRKTLFRRDEAILAISLLGLTSFHGLTMTPFWNQAIDLARVSTGAGPKLVFSVLMAAMLVLPLALFWATAWTSGRMLPDANVPAERIFRAFAYSVIPIALFYHLAHNGMHFFMEGQKILPLLSDPFGFGWDLFGTAGKHFRPWLTLRTIWWLQISLIVIGHIAGVIAADHIARTIFPNRKDVIKGLAPLIVTMIAYSSFSVWLIAQPMEMRSGM